MSKSQEDGMVTRSSAYSPEMTQVSSFVEQSVTCVMGVPLSLAVSETVWVPSELESFCSKVD